jgi:hypothetical protein
MAAFWFVKCITLRNGTSFVKRRNKNLGKKLMSVTNLLKKQFGKIALTTACSVAAFTLAMNPAFAGPREKARYIYDRIAGVPPDNATLTSMTTNISGGNVDAAINTAMANKNFLNVTVKNMVIPWTNKTQTVFAPLNDAAATIIGYVRDGYDFRGILSDNRIYVGTHASLSSFPYATNNNNHYERMEYLDLDLATVLTETTQTSASTLSLPAEAVAGVITTRQSAKEFFYLGTNRAMFRFTMLNYMCTDLEQIMDITRTNDRIRQDVSRSPGGDSDVFLNNCIGCHAGMDGMAGSFAYYDWNMPDRDANNEPVQATGNLTYNTSPVTYDLEGTPVTSRVTKKTRHNLNNFIYGYVTTDDSWKNYWRTGVNAKLQWSANSPQAPSVGSGVAALGTELAATGAFARCQAVKVYRTVCHADPDETTLTNTLVPNFQSSTYNMRQLFIDSVKDCMTKNPNL